MKLLRRRKIHPMLDTKGATKMSLGQSLLEGLRVTTASFEFEVSTTSFRRCHWSTVSPITQATGHLYISRINPINNEIIKSNLWDLDGYNVYLHHIIDIRVLKIYLNCERAADLIV